MSHEIKSTTPKPFIFVLMPFDKKFDDIYKYGIKGAAEKVGAYAERVDEQNFTEGILDRIYNQINKADVIVADMTGRNANVCYEVGYAHALGKIVLLLTQNIDDIPFDFKHRPHIDYEGKIDKLERDLTKKLIWAIGESSRKGKQNSLERIFVYRKGVEIPEGDTDDNIPVLTVSEESKFYLTFDIYNNSSETTPAISYISLLASPDSKLCLIEPMSAKELDEHYSDPDEFIDTYPEGIDVITSIDALTKQFRIKGTIPSMPPQAVERLFFKLGVTNCQKEGDTVLMIRLHFPNIIRDFTFKIRLLKEKSAE